MEEIIALVNLVRNCRAAQREYFATRAYKSLIRSKELERKVDEQVEKVSRMITEGKVTQLEFKF